MLRPGVVELNGLVFASYGTGTPLVVDGVLEVDVERAVNYTLATGSTLRGIRLLQGTNAFVEDQDPDELDDANRQREAMVVLRAEPGGYFTVTHEDGTVATATERLAISSGADAIVGGNRIQVFRANTASGLRFEVPDWSGYAPTDPTNWDGAPTTLSVGTAFDELAVRAPRRTTGTTAITSGVPSVVWSRTVPEGASVVGEVRVWAAFDDSGTIQHSNVVTRVGVSRDTGGSPGAVDGTPSLEGTIPLGVAELDVSGNDVRLLLTYSATGTIGWTILDSTEAITPP